MSSNAVGNHLAVRIGQANDMHLEVENIGDTTITSIVVPIVEMRLDKVRYRRDVDVRARIRFEAVNSALQPGGRVTVNHSTYFWDDNKNDWITNDDINTHNDMLIHLKDGEPREVHNVEITFTDDEGTKHQTVRMGKDSGL